jgi:NAD+ diphosphatase
MHARHKVAAGPGAWQFRFNQAGNIVRPIPASRANIYTGSPIDRVSQIRDDEVAMLEARTNPAARFLPVWRGRSLLADAPEGGHKAVMLEASALPDLGDRPQAFLGLHGETPVFTFDISDVDEPLSVLPEALGALIDLRSIAGKVEAKEASMLAHARGLMHWRVRHQFCGVCGGKCEPRSAGNALACPQCGAQHFPRTDPAVIMLVVNGDSVLLGHSKRFPNSSMYSTLAGFVEPGESFEEAVAREVFEEAGVKVGRVFYHSSQPWPFPASVMIGFHAEALSTDIKIDPEELEDARWFTRAQLRDPESVGISLPRVDSIARRLIEDWMNAE